MSKARLPGVLVALVTLVSSCGPRPAEARIAFSWDRDGDWEIYVVASEGGVATRLTEGSGVNVDSVWCCR